MSFTTRHGEYITIARVGMIPFKKPGKSDPYHILGANAAKNALKDAGIDYNQVQQGFVGYIYGDSCSGKAALYNVGLSGIPIVNLNNNCASGSTAFSLAAQAVSSGSMDCVLALGFEEMKPGALGDVNADRLSQVERHNLFCVGLL